MKMRIALLAAVVMLAACVGPRQPEPPAGGNPQPMTARDSLQRQLIEAYREAQMPSVFALIGARERLKLTSPQVSALDSIAEIARTQNRVLTDSLRSLTNSGSGGPIRQPRGEFQTRRFIPILHHMGDNNRRALGAVQAVLTPEQRTAVCTMVAEQREERGERRRGVLGGLGGDGGRRRGMRGEDFPVYGDSVAGRPRRGAGGWPWCAPARSVRVDSARVAAP
ncbi:MAG TPA: hypothetical protein VFS20_24265 [Longimicrobium sp.]|nr:hypothetical protein [Longimicrobium sp.]